MSKTILRTFATIGVLACAIALSAPAFAKAARCFTTDDGAYPCDFQASGGDGSFTISAPGKPTFSLTMDGPGVAFGSAVYQAGGNSVSLPGQYKQSADDQGCWINDSTSTRICAW